MSVRTLPKGTTSKLLRFFVPNAATTTGEGLTGLSSGSASLTAYYAREGDSVTAVINLTNTSLGNWTSGGIVPVDATNMPGVYEIGCPNAALATGASSVVIFLKGASNMSPVPIEIQLNADDAILDGVVTELSAAPTAPYTVESILAWLLAISKFKRTQTSGTETVFKDDGSTSLATSSKTDDNTTFTRNEYA